MVTKLVNVYAPIAIRTVKPPVYGRVNNITMSLSDILKCLYSRATVEEVLSDGTTVKLTTKNYRDDHSHLVKTTEVETVDQIQDNIEADDVQTHTPEVEEVADTPVPDNDEPVVTNEDKDDIIVEDAQDDVDLTVTDVAECEYSTTINGEDEETSEVTEDQPAPKKNTSSNKKKKTTK